MRVRELNVPVTRDPLDGDGSKDTGEGRVHIEGADDS